MGFSLMIMDIIGMSFIGIDIMSILVIESDAGCISHWGTSFGNVSVMKVFKRSRIGVKGNMILLLYITKM